MLTADGRAVDIGQASATGNYIGLINPTSVRSFDRWGVTEQVQGPLIGRYEAGYTEGSSAGTLQFAARALALDGTFLGGVTLGPISVMRRARRSVAISSWCAPVPIARDSGLLRAVDQPGIATDPGGRG